MLNYLVNSTHPKLSHVVDQCARFSQDPKASHEAAVKSVARYLLITRSQGGKDEPKYRLNMRPDRSKGLEVYVDASFAGD
eukprot:12923221-Ditylum_brightwellii.AAC.1